MGMLINGKWEKTPLSSCNKKGEFIRKDSAFRDWIKNDGSTPYVPEAGRYHLYISYACPWACRTLIMRKLKGLESIISLSIVDAFMGDMGWSFGVEGKDTLDSINGAKYCYEIYKRADADYTGKVTVPILWDKKQQTIVNNESAEIIRMLNSEFNEFASNNYDFYPEKLKTEINEINAFVYENINNGVYKTGFATSQMAYEEAFDNLFNAIEVIENKLAKQRYLVGNGITEADWRLFTTLIRFDVVYVGHFKCNFRRIADYPNLSNYLRDLYQVPGVKETVNFKHIKNHYYKSHTSINPTGIVPKGPEVDYDASHDRNKFNSL